MVCNAVKILQPGTAHCHGQDGSETKTMAQVSINKKPCNWMNPKAAGLKESSLNVSSLRRHIDNVKSDPALLQSDILCLQELWPHPGEEEGEHHNMSLRGVASFQSSTFPRPPSSSVISTFAQRGNPPMMSAPSSLSTISTNM